MSHPDSPDSRGWVEGSELSLNELCVQYHIPRDEAASFQSMVRIYPRDSVLIREGDLDKTLFLLRSGLVGIYRNSGADLRRLGTVEAINFVGEMSLILDEPRSATVVVHSEEVVVYAIARPNLHMILANPKWAEILVSRLSKDLLQANTERTQANARAAELQAENHRLVREIVNRNQQTRLLLDAVLVLQRAVRNLAVVGSKGWHYIHLLSEALRRLAGQYTPGLELAEDGADFKVLQACLEGIQKSEAHSNVKSAVDELIQEVQKQQ